MSENASDENVQKAVTFCTQAGLTRLLSLMRQKYIEVGQVGGQVVLNDSTALERREIASLLGKPPYPPEKPLRVRLVDFEKALLHSFGCGLPALLTAAFPDQPLITRRTVREASAEHQARFRVALTAIASSLLEQARGRCWLQQGAHGGEWLFARYKNAPVEEQEQQLSLVSYIATILDQLPPSNQPERLALFAQRTSGDPHTLDANRATGRLFLLALNDLADMAAGTTSMPQSRADELRLYTEASLLVDTISSNVAVFNLVVAFDTTGKPDPLLQVAGKRVLLLPLRLLLTWERVLADSPVVYIFENPQVFEAVIATLDLDAPLPTLICTSGWPSVAAMTLLDQLIVGTAEIQFRYSGDFDLKGLQIAAHLMGRYPGRCSPWHFTPEAYAVALQSGGIPARPNDLNALNSLPAIFAPLVASMQEQQKWAYQEGITQVLAKDITTFFPFA
jgi:uncharacterized protein (TIGR02679 family)